MHIKNPYLTLKFVIHLSPIICIIFILNPFIHINVSSANSQDKIQNSWTSFHKDEQNTGNTSSFGPNHNSLLMNFSFEGEIKSSPGIVGNKIFFGSTKGMIYCMDLNDGSLIWSYNTNDNIEESSPAISENKVIIGSNDGSVYCLNASTGKLIWNFTTNYKIHSSPTIVEEKVFFGSYDGDLYCLNKNTGQKIWNYSSSYWIHTSPAVDEKKVFFGSCDANLYCLNSSTGEKIWNYTAFAYIPSSPVVSNGKVFFGSFDQNLYCVDTETGKHIWNFTTNDAIYSSPAVGDGKVFFGSDDGNIYCVDENNGDLIWNYSTKGSIKSSPAISNNYVYFGSDDKNLYCLDKDTGEKIWNYETEGEIISSPAIANNKIYVGSNDGNIYCFGGAITSHVNHETVSGEVTIQGIIPNNNESINSIQLRIDDGNWEDVSYRIPWEYLWNTSLVENGNHTIWIRFFNGTNYLHEQNIILKVDNNQAPVLNVLYPLEGQIVSGIVIIKGNSSDDCEVISIKLKIDDGNWTDINNRKDWQYFWNTENITEGEHQIAIQVNDGEKISEKTIMVVVNNINNDSDGNTTFYIGITCGIIVVLLIRLTINFKNKKKKNI